MTNLSFFTKYPTQGATSRYRSFAFASRLAELNYNIEIHSFMDIHYLSNLFAKKPKNTWRIFLSYCQRLFAVLRSSDNMMIERELFPYLPYGFEKLFLRNKRYILDFDDNVWEDYRGKLLLDGKYDHLVKNATGVIVGNHYLEHSVKKLNARVIKIPTVINLEHYQPDNSVQKFERFSLVWIGSSVTYRYIKAFAPMFQQLSKLIDFDLLIIASTQLESEKIEGVSMKFYDWSSETETLLLQQSHVGIMPLTDDPFSQGKSGFKLIQYQAAGLPMVASPVGENTHIVEHGKNGYLASDPSEWILAIQKLASDPEHYAALSNQSKERSYQFSIQHYFPIYKQFINETFKETSTT
ncbi:MAG TPA: glycosyltransferase family 4 protein [Sulfuricurvum sp.]|nr:glycosyltransferase family 4 protein [Sulfuricurvum sp.]